MTADHPNKRSAAKAATGGKDMDAVTTWLISRLAAHLQVPASQIGVKEPFASFGIDSMQAIAIAGELEKWLGRKVSPTALWEHPDIETLARHIVG